MWDGNFWVRIRSDRPLDPLPPSPLRPLARVHASDTRGFRPGGMVLAGVVAPVMSNIHPTLPFSDGSAAATLTEMRLAGILWTLFTYVAVAVIISIGRQGIDAILIRSFVVGFVMGAALMAVVPIYVFSIFTWFLAIFVAACIWAVTTGPLLAGMAILANLLWYRSFWSLRPQLGIFNRAAEELR